MNSADIAQGFQHLSQADKQELAEHVERSQQQQQVSEVVHSLSATCFKKCIPGKISSDALSSAEQTCAKNCVGRFIDVQSSILRNLSAQGAQPSAQPAKGGFFG